MDDIVKLAFITSMLLAVGTFVMFMVPIALRNFRKANMVGRESSEELEAMRAELDQLRELPPRMAELEERLDFAERLLSANRAAGEQLRDGSS